MKPAGVCGLTARQAALPGFAAAEAVSLHGTGAVAVILLTLRCLVK
jgi:hypothetical protein